MNTQPLVKTEINFRQSSSSAEIRRDILSRVVEAEIIPRLLMVHRPAENASAPLSPRPTPAEVAAFSNLLLADDLPANRNHPLAATAPELRDARRLRLIATVLARLARGEKP